MNVDLARPYDLSLGPDRAGRGPRHFGAEPAAFQAWHTNGFIGALEQGGRCNCSVLTHIAHCHGTHTECVGHLTREPLDAIDFIPSAFIPALLLSVRAVRPAETTETTTPAPRPDDALITARDLQAAALSVAPQPSDPSVKALIVRTLPNDASKRYRAYVQQPAPFLTREAANWLLGRGIEHLVVDLPTIDRAHDEGCMTAHRIFFGLPAGSSALGEALRRFATITELAFIPDELRDGLGQLLLQAPRLPGDAVPSRPFFYPHVARG